MILLNYVYHPLQYLLAGILLAYYVNMDKPYAGMITPLIVGTGEVIITVYRSYFGDGTIYYTSGGMLGAYLIEAMLRIGLNIIAGYAGIVIGRIYRNRNIALRDSE